eukprot:4766591-Prymnesium_polylepis.2
MRSGETPSAAIAATPSTDVMRSGKSRRRCSHVFARNVGKSATDERIRSASGSASYCARCRSSRKAASHGSTAKTDACHASVSSSSSVVHRPSQLPSSMITRGFRVAISLRSRRSLPAWTQPCMNESAAGFSSGQRRSLAASRRQPRAMGAGGRVRVESADEQHVASADEFASDVIALSKQ